MLLRQLLDRLRTDRDDGFSTAEAIAGAALATITLIAIWAAMRGLGVSMIDWIKTQLQSAS